MFLMPAREDYAMKYLRTLFAASLLLLLPALAHAQLTLSLVTPDQNGLPGETVAFEGTLRNDGSSLLFLSGDTFNLNGTGLTLDDIPFFVDGPLLLDPGASFTGLLFNVLIEPTAPPQIAPGTFTILGGPIEGDQGELATVNFSVSVSAPEPASSALLLGTLVAFGLATRRRVSGKRNTERL